VTRTKNRYGKGKAKTGAYDQSNGFSHIRQIPEVDVKELNKARSDLQETIEKTIRIHLAIVRKLTPYARVSNRVQAVIAKVEEIAYLGTVQRQIAGPKLTDIITLREVANDRKRKRVEAAVNEAKRKARKHCTHEDLFSQFQEPCRCEEVTDIKVDSEITDYLSDVSA
jgi:hypothetical protein